MAPRFRDPRPKDRAQEHRRADPEQPGARVIKPAAVIPMPRANGVLTFPAEHPRIETDVRQSRAKSTLRGYRSDWREFEAWCAEHGAAHIPADQGTICGYLAACA